MSRENLIPVSDFAEGLTVRGQVLAETLILHCPGPAGLWPCGFELGHPGDHMRLEDAGEVEFNGYVFDGLNEVLPKVRALVAERDALLAIVQGAGGVTLHFKDEADYEALEEYLDQRADVRDTENGPVPDKAMRLLMAVREAKR